MSILKFLGRGNAFNVLEGNTSAYIKEDNHLFLIDCGETVFQKMMKLNLLNNVSTIDIVITHLHSDHIGSLPSLLYYLHFIKKIKPNIYYPDADDLHEILSKQCPHINDNDVDGCNYKLISVPEYDTYKINNILSIGFQKVKHVSSFNSYAVYITYCSKNIYYSGDTSELGFLKYLCILNEIYTDCTSKDYKNNPHLSFDKLSTAITKYHDRNIIYLMHVDEGMIDKSKEFLNGFRLVEVEGEK